MDMQDELRDIVNEMQASVGNIEVFAAEGMDEQGVYRLRAIARKLREEIDIARRAALRRSDERQTAERNQENEAA